MSRISIVCNGQGFQLTPSIHRCAEDAALEIASATRQENTTIEAHLGPQSKGNYRALFKTHFRGHDFVAKACCGSLYVAIAEAREKMIHQIQEFRGRRNDARRRSRAYLQHHPILQHLA